MFAILRRASVFDFWCAHCFGAMVKLGSGTSSHGAKIQHQVVVLGRHWQPQDFEDLLKTSPVGSWKGIPKTAMSKPLAKDRIQGSKKGRAVSSWWARRNSPGRSIAPLPHIKRAAPTNPHRRAAQIMTRATGAGMATRYAPGSWFFQANARSQARPRQRPDCSGERQAH